jgi:hypothetical protein
MLFWVAGIYDLAIGTAFLSAGAKIFDWAGVPHPNHWAYLQFASMLLLIFGLMFIAIGSSPISNRNLIPYGMLLKASYASLTIYYWVRYGCPDLFKPFAIIDLMMLFLFITAYQAVPRLSKEN